MKKRITAILFAVLGSLTLCAVTMPLEDFSDLSAWKSDSYTPNTKFEKTADRPGITIHAPGGIYRMLPAKFGQYRNQGRNFNGISFKVKGDGSGNFGSISIGQRWGWCFSWHFPLENKEWTEYKVAWEDMNPVWSWNVGKINGRGGLTPGGIDFLGIGNKWKIGYFNAPVAAHQYSIADVRLVEDAATKYADHNGKARAIQDVVKNMKEGKNVTVVSVGDSITAGARLRSPQAESYSAVMQKKLREQFRNDRITVSAHAVGGATLIDLLNWMERDIGNTPPDLITILIGTNDKSTGKSCASYAMQFNEYIGRLIAKTQGRSAILLINAVPGKYYRWDMMDDYADAVKEIGNRRGLPVCDLYGAMRALGREKVAGLLADLLHPNAAGHQAIGEIVANSVIQAE